MASCSSATPVSFNVQYFYSDQCFTCGDDCGPNVQNSKCVVYTGPNLSCSGIETNDSLEVALQKIDEQICSATGDYSTYQMNCLPTWWGEEISTESEFVDAITDYVCTLNDTVDTFINTTFVSYQSSVDTRFDAIEYPGITCAIAGVTNTDSLIQVLNKYCEEFEDIDDAIDISGIDWGGCFSVLTPPTNIAEGFTYLLGLICDLNNNVQPLPTFDNSANCLAGTVEDSLETTVGVIITRLCQAPTWDSDNVTWGCITAPVDTGDLEEAVQNIVDVVNDLQQNFVTFDNSDFTVTATDGLDPCAGITVSLATPINQDRFVAVSAGDASPGTLFSKLSTPNSSVAITNVADTTVGLDVSTGDKGDITVSGGGNTWTIDNDTVTFAKMQNINTSRLIGRSTAGSGDPEEIQIGSNLVLSGGVLDTSQTIPTLDYGTYTPSLTNASNVTSSTSNTAQWMRVGDVVTVSGTFDIVFTTNLSVTSLYLELPIPSAFSTEFECSGTACSNGSQDNGGFSIRGNVANNVAEFYAVAPGSSLSVRYRYTYTYYITAP